MQPNTFKFTRDEVLEAVAKLAYSDMSAGTSGITNGPASNGNSSNGHVMRGNRRSRRAKAAYTKPSEVSEKQVLELIRARGPLRVAEMMEITGLSQSAAHKKVAVLKKAGSIKSVMEGTIVRYMVSRGAASARKSARKKAGKSAKRSGRLGTKATASAPAAATS